MALRDKVKVTVAMPAYNASCFIREAIESVLAQEEDRFELLMIDDASTDETLKIMKSYRRDPRVRSYANKRHLGVGATRNRLLRLAQGNYITPCDADDLMLPGNLKRMSGILDKHPAIGTVYADTLVIEMDQEGIPLILGRDYRKAWDLFDNSINHPGSMIRKSLMVKVGGYDETVYSTDDWSLWLKLAEVTRFKYLRGEIYYVWRRHSKSLTRTDPHWASDVKRIKREAIQRRYGRTPW